MPLTPKQIMEGTRKQKEELSGNCTSAFFFFFLDLAKVTHMEKF